MHKHYIHKKINIIFVERYIKPYIFLVCIDIFLRYYSLIVREIQLLLLECSQKCVLFCVFVQKDENIKEHIKQTKE